MRSIVPNPGDATRREALGLGAGALALLVAPSARATPDEMRAVMTEFTRGAATRRGRVTLDVPPLVENGNTVPVTVRVESPMSEADHVRAVALFNEKNPQPHVAIFRLSPRNGRAEVQTRIRLADSQALMAIAEMSDGTFWSARADVVVTLAACVEG